ncbi:pentapeptide repeat-containing protein [Fischerella muscicola]|uniref:pentapeptide repeat-containing protein n=1 Tax=Fischerella muscicola TaxID=92938 RepID=UPI000313657E|nr:pentapeptide repeat-containing protein [Fischerella muscicola]
MATKLEKLRNFFTKDIPDFLKKPTNTTETGAEVSKASLELAVALGLLGTPLAPVGVAVAGLSFVGLTAKAIKFYQEKTGEASLEECVSIAARVAYVESFEKILNTIEDKDLLAKVGTIHAGEAVAEGFIDINEEEARKAITCFRETKLAQEFNRQLSYILKVAGLSPTEAETFTQRVAWNTQRYMNQALAEAGDTVKNLAGLFRDGWRKELEKYQSLDEYLEKQIATKPREKVFAEKFTFKNIYVPLQAQPLDTNGQEDNEKQSIDLETWAKDLLQESDKQDKVLFIQGGPGRGKSVFCRMFADWMRQNLYPIWTPILIRLRDIRTFEKNFENTISQAVDRDFAKNDDGWLTDKNIRYLFLLDGFDELLMEKRTSDGLEEFLKQVGGFQESCQRNPEKGHRLLITGRTLALQSIERNMPANLERVEILPMDEGIQEQWFEKWSAQVGTDKTVGFQQFLQNQNCPDRVRELAQEPLLLYLLAAMHRDGELTVEMFADANGTQAKILIYQKSLDWVLTEQRPEILNRELTEQDTEDLRRILTEAGLCVVQSGGECAAISMIEKRLDDTAKNLLEEARKRIGDNPLRNALAAFYLQPGKQTGSVEFAHKSFSEFLCAERLKESLENWTEPGRKGRGFNIQQDQMDWEIYDLLGYGGLTLEIVEYLMGLLTVSNEFRPVQLFQRLHDFYQRWSGGEFIDAYTETLPQKKSRQLHEQNISLGQRQVDVYTGLNVMILLLELHRYAQKGKDLKEQIIFYPSGQADEQNRHTIQMLRIINYSDCIQLGTFNSVVGEFLSNANLSRAYLSGANLISADLSGANLSRAYLSDADLSRAYLSDANLSYADLSGAILSGAILSDADLSGAILSGAILSDADLSGAILSGAILSGANLSGANLSRAILSYADLSGANLISANLSDANLSRANLSGVILSNEKFGDICWDEGTKWEGVRGLETAVNVPEALKQQLGLE